MVGNTETLKIDTETERIRAHLPSLRSPWPTASLMMLRPRRTKSGFRGAAHLRHRWALTRVNFVLNISKPLFINEVSSRGGVCGGRQESRSIRRCALPVTARKLAASARRADKSNEVAIVVFNAFPQSA